MNEDRSDLDQSDDVRREATVAAQKLIETYIRGLGYRLWQKSSGSLRIVHAYENQVGDEVVLFVETTDYNNIQFDVSVKSTDPTFTEHLQSFLNDAKQASAEYANLLNQYRTITELSA